MNGLHRYRLQKQLNALTEQRRNFARFESPTAVKKIAQFDEEIAELLELLAKPVTRRVNPATPNDYVHPATGQLLNGL